MLINVTIRRPALFENQHNRQTCLNCYYCKQFKFSNLNFRRENSNSSKMLALQCCWIRQFWVIFKQCEVRLWIQRRKIPNPDFNHFNMWKECMNYWKQCEQTNPKWNSSGSYFVIHVWWQHLSYQETTTFQDPNKVPKKAAWKPLLPFLFLKMNIWIQDSNKVWLFKINKKKFNFDKKLRVKISEYWS